MKRLLILGITIASFAFILSLIGCGPVANTNVADNGAGKAAVATPTPTPHPACSNPNYQDLQNAVADVITKDNKLKHQYNQDDPDQGSINFVVTPDLQKGGFFLILEGNLGHDAFEELRWRVESFASSTCIKKVIFTPRHAIIPPHHRSSDEALKGVDVASAAEFFGWDLTCQDPSHPCSDGSCAGANTLCNVTKTGGNSDTNQNENMNANNSTMTNASPNKNTNR